MGEKKQNEEEAEHIIHQYIWSKFQEKLKIFLKESDFEIRCTRKKDFTPTKMLDLIRHFV